MAHLSVESPPSSKRVYYAVTQCNFGLDMKQVLRHALLAAAVARVDLRHVEGELRVAAWHPAHTREIMTMAIDHVLDALEEAGVDVEDDVYINEPLEFEHDFENDSDSGCGVSHLHLPPPCQGSLVDVLEVKSETRLVPHGVLDAKLLANLYASKELVEFSRLSVDHRMSMDGKRCWIALLVWEVRRNMFSEGAMALKFQNCNKSHKS